MTGAIVGLVALYCLVIFGGKHSDRPGAAGFMFIGLIAALQVAAVLFFVYVINVPDTK